MSIDHDFEQLLAARMGAAAEPVTGAGVTQERVEGRVAQRRRSARRRQGLVAIAAAVVVVIGGVGIAAAVGDGDRPERTGLASDPFTTEAPTTDPCVGTTEPPTTEPPSTTTDTTLAPTTPPDTTRSTLVEGETTTVPADVDGTGPATTPGPTANDPCVPITTEPPSTTTETTAPTSSTITSPVSTEPELVPGQTCAPGSSPDCIDPDGDGTYTYLIGGADCMANPIGDSGNVYAHCIDLDGDGEAGYGDEGESEAEPGGGACAPGTNPDCIDPEGDGTYVYLIGGADCMASPIGGEMCADLDGDGHAGYPDSEG